MANKAHVEIIAHGSVAWNYWRRKNSAVVPDLRDAELPGVNLANVNLRKANLRSADLSGANLSGADLSAAQLKYVDLRNANLSEALLFEASLNLARLRGANFRRANLTDVDLEDANLDSALFCGAKLIRANLCEADLRSADFNGADLAEANLTGAQVGNTAFGSVDLTVVKGLDSLIHSGPSTIGIDTLFMSHGKIAEVFLREAGVPEDFITLIPSIVGRAIEFYSCFISHSHQDREFSHRLHSRMRRENLRVWYAPEDIKGGRKLHEEIFSAIQIHDKLLLVLSEASMKSEWVTTEIRRARKVEREENRRKLFPIRLVDFEAIQKWECFDADGGKDLAIELREYYIPDFSNWKDHDVFEVEFAKLLRDLRATESCG